MSIKKLANPHAYRNNILVIHSSESGCCGESGKVCNYLIETAFADGVKALIIDEPLEGGGTNRLTINFLETETSPKGIRKAIADALRACGYDPYYDMDTYKGVHTELDKILLTGEAHIVGIINGNDEEVGAAQRCGKKPIFVLELNAISGTSLGELSFNNQEGTEIAEFSVEDSVDTIKDAVSAAFEAQNPGDLYDIKVGKNLKTGDICIEVHVCTDGYCIGERQLVVCKVYPAWVELPAPGTIVKSYQLNPPYEREQDWQAKECIETEEQTQSDTATNDTDGDQAKTRV